jgi:hypothetical protein
MYIPKAGSTICFPKNRIFNHDRYTQRTSKYDSTVISLCQMQGINLQATYSVSENLQRRRWHKSITVKSYFEVR